MFNITDFYTDFMAESIAAENFYCIVEYSVSIVLMVDLVFSMVYWVYLIFLIVYSIDLSRYYFFDMNSLNF